VGNVLLDVEDAKPPSIGEAKQVKEPAGVNMVARCYPSSLAAMMFSSGTLDSVHHGTRFHHGDSLWYAQLRRAGLSD
jgi:hypothetical protein